MKLNFITLTLLVLLSLGSLLQGYAQCTSMPTTAEELAECNLAIAQRFAPRHRQEVDTDGDVGDSLNGKSDFITAIDYDGDWACYNNWENLSEFPNSLFKAYVYYSVVWTKTHWYIVYGYYHPRDWTHHSGHSTHENDFEGLLVIVRRPSANVIDLNNSVLEAAITVFHNDFYSYTTAGSSFTDGEEDIDGTLHVHNGTHPKTAQESEGHGCRSWDDIDENEEGEVVYRSNMANVAEWPSSIEDTDVKYALVDIFEAGGLWSRRNNWETFAEYGKFNGTEGGINKACAPWAWDDHNDGPTYAGEMGVDPAHLVDHYFDSSYPISDCYQFLPYRCSYSLQASKTSVCSGKEVSFTIKRGSNLPLNQTTINWQYNSFFWECVSNDCDADEASITLRAKKNFPFTLSVSATLETIDCGTISNSQLIRHIQPGDNCAEPRFQLTEANGQIQTNFCGGEDVYFDGSASQNETSFYLSLARRSIGSTGSFAAYGSLPVTQGTVGAFNLTQALLPLTITGDYEYELSLWVKNASTGWTAFKKRFRMYASCCQTAVDLDYQCKYGRIIWDLSSFGEAPSQYWVSVSFNDPFCCESAPTGGSFTYQWKTTQKFFYLPFISLSNCFSFKVGTLCGDGTITWSEKACSGCKKKAYFSQLRLEDFSDASVPGTLKVYPNPTQGQLELSLTTPPELQVRVEVYTLQGQLVQALKEQTVTDGHFQTSFRLRPTLPKGVYIVLLKTNHGIFQERVLLQE